MPSLQSMKLANDDFIQINYREWPTLSSFIGPCEEEQVIDEVSHANGLRLHTFTRDSCTRRIALGQSNLGPHPQRGEGAPQFVKRVADKLLSLLRGSTIAAIGSSVLRASESEPRFDRCQTEIIFVTQSARPLSTLARAVLRNSTRRSTATTTRLKRTDQASPIRTATPNTHCGFQESRITLCPRKAVKAGSMSVAALLTGFVVGGCAGGDSEVGSAISVPRHGLRIDLPIVPSIRSGGLGVINVPVDAGSPGHRY